jgi:hypothetical protein
MPHVLRDRDGRIMAVLDRPSAGPTEEVEPQDPDLARFLDDAGVAQGDTEQAFLRADLEFIRVLEDLVVALMDRNVISLTDLPADAQRKVMDRANLRRALVKRMPVIGNDDTERLF